MRGVHINWVSDRAANSWKHNMVPIASADIGSHPFYSHDGADIHCVSDRAANGWKHDMVPIASADIGSHPFDSHVGADIHGRPIDTVVHCHGIHISDTRSHANAHTARGIAFMDCVVFPIGVDSTIDGSC